MRQCYKIVNLDKMQYIDPNDFNEGEKLLEFSCNIRGTLTALSLLLSDGCGRGGGDLYTDKTVVGSWAGDRIVVTGDYADKGKFTSVKDRNVYQLIQKGAFLNISKLIIDAMKDDGCLKQRLEINGIK